MLGQARKSKKNIERTYTVGEGRPSYLNEITEDAKALIEDPQKCTQKKLKQLKLRLKEELDSLKTLDDLILNLILDDRR